MTVALYDDTLKQAVAQWISRQTNTDVGIGSVQPLPIFSLTITENNTGASTTLRYGNVPPNTSLSLSPVMDVYFRNLDASTATQLTSLIDTQDADFSFTFFYKTSSNTFGAYTRRRVAQSAVGAAARRTSRQAQLVKRLEFGHLY